MSTTGTPQAWRAGFAQGVGRGLAQGSRLEQAGKADAAVEAVLRQSQHHARMGQHVARIIDGQCVREGRDPMADVKLNRRTGQQDAVGGRAPAGTGMTTRRPQRRTALMADDEQ